MVAQSPTSVRVAQNLATHTPLSWEEKINLFTLDIFYIKRRFEMYLLYEDQKAWRLKKTYFNVDQPPNLANLACVKLAQPG